jgi:phenylacetate-CoA ligase
VQVVTNGVWTDASVGEIESGLRQRMGEGVAIDVRLLDGIAPEASGKHRYVVSHVALSGALGAAAHTR